MKLLQIGVPKSGNFWLYQIIQQILKYSNNHAPSFIEQHPIQEIAKTWPLNYPGQSKIDVIDITDLQSTYRISSIFKMPIDNFESYLAKTNHVWTHSPVCKRSGEVLELFNKKVYIIRDPRDVIISASKYYCSEYMLKFYPQKETDPQKYLKTHLEELITEWVWHVWDYLRISKKYNIHIAFFEGFKLNFQEELIRLLQYLEINLTTEMRQELEQSVSFETMKKENPKHLKKGETGYWMQQLSQEEIKKANSIAGPLLQVLGYPIMDSPRRLSREFSHNDFGSLKEEIIKAQKVRY